MNSRLKVFPTDLLKGLRIRSGHFGGAAEIARRLLSMQKKIVEVSSDCVFHLKAESKKMNWLLAFHIFGCFLIHRFSYARA
ncbi:MAG: hypothetical protein V1882_01365 [Candidatus Omnitrophota bacterium]